MEIEEIKKIKEESEDQILEILDQFTAKTGLYLKEIALLEGPRIGQLYSEVVHVEIKTALPEEISSRKRKTTDDKKTCQTLNDLIGCDERKGKEGSICPNCGTSHTITEELLKKEAYKWLRELKRNPIEFQCEDEAPRVCDSLMRWIENFFNVERHE